MKKSNIPSLIEISVSDLINKNDDRVDAVAKAISSKFDIKDDGYLRGTIRHALADYIMEAHGLDKGDVDFLQSLVDRMERGKTWKAEEFKPLKRILQFIIKSNITVDSTRALNNK